MNQDQIGAFVREAFFLNDIADIAVKNVDQVLAVVMKNVRVIIQRNFPEEGLLRGRAWRDIEPLIKLEMEPYAQALKQSIERAQVRGSETMLRYAEREAMYAGAVTPRMGAPTPASVVSQFAKAEVAGKTVARLFPPDAVISPWAQQMWRVVDREVQRGMVEGLTTKAIADNVVHETISKGVPGVSLQGNTSVRKIRAQATAMARTVTADVSRQIKEDFWEANKKELKGFVFQWSSALDSRTCPSCGVLDGRTWPTVKRAAKDGARKPVHVNCRCDLLLIDPEDEFWQEDKRNGQQIKPMYVTTVDENGNPKRIKTKPYSPERGGYKTPIKVNGEQYWRRTQQFTGNNFGDYIASSNLETQTQFFGGGAVGTRRARYFRNQMDKVNKDPQQILVDMLTGSATAKRFIPVSGALH